MWVIIRHILYGVLNERFVLLNESKLHTQVCPIRIQDIFPLKFTLLYQTFLVIHSPYKARS